jgi:hypothetical protein
VWRDGAAPDLLAAGSLFWYLGELDLSALEADECSAPGRLYGSKGAADGAPLEFIVCEPAVQFEISHVPTSSAAGARTTMGRLA